MKRKLVVLLLLLVVGVSCFSGCGQKMPEASELLDNLFGTSDVESMDITLKMDIGMEMDMSEMGEEGTTMGFGMSGAIDMQVAEDVSHASGKVKVSFLGMTHEQEVETYVDSDKIYIKDAENGVWSVSTATDEWPEIDTSMLDGLDSKLYESFEMQSTEKGSEEYVVTGVLNLKKLAEKFGAKEALESMPEEIDAEKLNLNVVVVFDSKTKVCKSMEFSIPEGVVNGVEGVSATNFKFGFDVNQVNGVSVFVPEDVKSNAVEEDTEVEDMFQF